MIYCNLSGLMAEKRINISTLSKETGISRTTLTSLYYNYHKGIQVDTINTLCQYFDISTDKLLIFSKYEISARFDILNRQSIDLEKEPKQLDMPIIFDISFGKVTKSCEVCCSLYFDWDLDSVSIETELEYYDNDEDKQLIADNVFFQKTLSGLQNEILNFIVEKVQTAINEYIDSEIGDNRSHVDIGKVSLSNLL